MKLLLDTNVIIDVLSRRAGYEASRDVLRHCESRKANGFISTVTVTDAMYILRKHAPPSEIKNAVQILFNIAEILEVRKPDLIAAFNSEMDDFEDAVQAACAARNKLDYVVTRNVKDFAKSAVRAVTPETMLKLFL